MTAAGKPYSRASAAEQAGVPVEDLRAWIDGRSTPRDSATLVKVAAVLAALAGESETQRKSEQPEKPESRRQKFHKGLTWTAITVVTILLGGLLAPISSNGRGIIWNLVFPGPGHPQIKDIEPLQATVAWCCSITTVEETGGYYWPGPAAGMEHWFAHPPSNQTAASLTPAGVGVIEIVLQTSGVEPIFVAPPKVLVRRRTPNVTHGVVAITPLYGQGNSAPGEFSADVDASTPATVAVGSSGNQDFYVSSTSAQTFILTLTDVDYDCLFDIQLTWTTQGRRQTRLLSNGGHHFRIVGSAGLPWYSGSPGIGEPFAPASGHPFSFYAPKNT